MKKLTIIAFALGILAMVGYLVAPSLTSEVEAGAKNATYVQWFWDNPETDGDGYKDAYFMATKSGIVHGWTYDHPDLGDARMMFKPLSKFKNATECDDGWIRERTDWTPKGIFNSALSKDDKDNIEMLFDMEGTYLFCAYPMD